MKSLNSNIEKHVSDLQNVHNKVSGYVSAYKIKSISASLGTRKIVRGLQ
jgi:hypothetical protein